MLVSSSMEYVFRTMVFEYLLHESLVGDASDYSFVLDISKLASHCQAYRVHRSLSLVDKGEFGRLVYSHLTHHFRTDRTGSTGYEHALAPKHSANGIHIHLNLLTRQQVFDFYLMQMIVCQVGFAVPLFSCRHHHDLDASLYKLINHGLIFAESLRLQRRHEQHLDMLISHQLSNALLVYEYLLAEYISLTHIIAIADECLKHILLLFSRQYTVGKAHTALHRSVYCNR